MSTEVATGGSHSSSGLPIGGVTSQEKAAALSPVVRPRKGLFSQEKDGGLQASAVPPKRNDRIKISRRVNPSTLNFNLSAESYAGGRIGSKRIIFASRRVWRTLSRTRTAAVGPSNTGEKLQSW